MTNLFNFCVINFVPTSKLWIENRTTNSSVYVLPKYECFSEDVHHIRACACVCVCKYVFVGSPTMAPTKTYPTICASLTPVKSANAPFQFFTSNPLTPSSSMAKGYWMRLTIPAQSSVGLSISGAGVGICRRTGMFLCRNWEIKERVSPSSLLSLGFALLYMTICEVWNSAATVMTVTRNDLYHCHCTVGCDTMCGEENHQREVGVSPKQNVCYYLHGQAYWRNRC